MTLATTFLIALLVVAPFNCFSQQMKSIEVSGGINFSNGKKGVNESFSSGKTTRESSALGWFAGVSKSWILNPRFNFNNGIYIRNYSYLVEYSYPNGYPSPINLSSEKFHYYFLSVSPAISYDVIKLNFLLLRSYAGLSVDALLNSSVDQKFSGTVPAPDGNQNLTKKEDKVNFTYLAGVKFILFPSLSHPVSINAMYNHYFKEQYNMGVSGRTLHSFQMGVGVLF